MTKRYSVKHQRYITRLLDRQPWHFERDDTATTEHSDTVGEITSHVLAAANIMIYKI